MFNRKKAVLGVFGIAATLFCFSAFADTSTSDPGNARLDLTCRFDGSGAGKTAGWDAHCNANVTADNSMEFHGQKGQLKVTCGNLGDDDGDNSGLTIIYDGKAFIRGIYDDSCQLEVKGVRDDAPVILISDYRAGHDSDKHHWAASLNYNADGYNYTLPGRCKDAQDVSDDGPQGE